MSRHREFVSGSSFSSVFTWKGGIFSPTCDRSKLRINWHFPRVLKQNECFQESESDEDVVHSSDHEMHSDSDVESIFLNEKTSFHDDHCSRTKMKDDLNIDLKEKHSMDHKSNKYWKTFACGSTEIDVFPKETSDGSVSVIGSGFSFDPLCCIRVPVILVAIHDTALQKNTSGAESCDGASKDKSVLTPKRLILLGLSEINNSFLMETLPHDQKNFETKIVQELDTHLKKSFKLIPLRTFSFREETNYSSFHQNIAFISNYRLLHVNIECGTLNLFSGSIHNMEKAQVDNFHWSNDKPKSCRIVLYDIYNCFETETVVFIALLEEMNTNESHSKTSTVMLLYSHQKISNQFELDRPEISQFFPQEFSQILLSLSILSTKSQWKLSGGSTEILSSSVIVISTTGYAIKFLNGEMTSCVQLTCSIESPVEPNVDVNIIDIASKSDHQSAISIGHTCDIIHWSQKKVSSSHGNVAFVCKYDRLGNGCQTFLLLLLPKSGQEAHQDMCVKDLIPLTIDGTESESDEELRPSSGVPKHHRRQDTAEENLQFGNVTQRVMEDLIFQEKKCEAELKETEQVVKNKEIFIENMQQMFSNDLSIEHKFDVRTKNLQPLVPLIEESQVEENLLTSQRQIFKFGEMWKRIVDSQLICGLEVTNVSKTYHLSGISLILMPLNPSSVSVKCNSFTSSKTSLSSSQLGAPVEKKMCLETDPTEVELNHMLKFRESASFVAIADATHVIGGENVVFKGVLIYSLHDGQESHAQKLLTENVCCGQFTMSVNDIVNGSYSLKPLLCGEDRCTFGTEDILALDCIQQKCFDLEVNSIMTSVLALKSSLHLCPSVSFISWTNQFIITADLAFRYCRIKWLKQFSKHNATIRICTRSQSEALLLVQFLYNLVPKDITITLPPNSCQPSISKVKNICQSLMDRVDNSITQIEKNMSAIITGPDCSIEKSALMNSNTLFDKADKTDNDEMEFQPHSPTFPSSGPKRGKTFQFQAHVFPSTSKTSSGDTERKISTSFNDRLNTVDPNLLKMSDPDSLRTKYSDAVKPSVKGKSSKGGLSKGKGKLMKKKLS